MEFLQARQCKPPEFVKQVNLAKSMNSYLRNLMKQHAEDQAGVTAATKLFEDARTQLTVIQPQLSKMVGRGKGSNVR